MPEVLRKVYHVSCGPHREDNAPDTVVVHSHRGCPDAAR